MLPPSSSPGSQGGLRQPSASDTWGRAQNLPLSPRSRGGLLHSPLGSPVTRPLDATVSLLTGRAGREAFGHRWRHQRRPQERPLAGKGTGEHEDLSGAGSDKARCRAAGTRGDTTAGTAGRSGLTQGAWPAQSRAGAECEGRRRRQAPGRARSRVDPRPSALRACSALPRVPGEEPRAQLAAGVVIGPRGRTRRAVALPAPTPPRLT